MQEKGCFLNNLAWTPDEREGFWLAGLAYSGDGEKVTLANSRLPNLPCRVSYVTETAGEYFSPSVVRTGDKLHVFWIGRQGEDYRVFTRTFVLPVERAKSGSQLMRAGEPIEAAALDSLDEGVPISCDAERAYNLVTLGDEHDSIWAFWEAWSEEKVAIKGRRWQERAGWSEEYVVPTGSSRAYWPTLAVAADGVWLAWTEPNASADGYDIRLTYCRNGDFDEAIKLNNAPGFHLYPSLALDGGGRPWVAWCHDSPEDYYQDLTSSVPYLQTPWARQKRNIWFKKFHIALRGADDSGQWTIDPDGTSDVPAFEHALWPVLGFDSVGRPVLLARNYEPGSQLFYLQMAVGTDGGWQTRVVGGGGSVQAAPARAFFRGVLLYLGWITNPDGHGQEARPEFKILSMTEFPGSAPLPHLRQDQGEPTATPVASKSPGFIREDSCQEELHAGGGAGSWLTLFGNIHIHTEVSKCRRPTSHSLDLNYRWSMDCMRQDFASLTDHAETKTPYQWWLNRKTARFYDSAAFTSLLGYEWTFNLRDRQVRHHGHVNVYLRNDSTEFWDARSEKSDSLEKLWSLLPVDEAITIPHHPAAFPFQRNWCWHDPEREPVVEIHQDRRGSFEFRGCAGGGVLSPEQLLDGCFVQDALAKGYRLGFVSGGDHQGLSLTAVLAAGRNRGEIFSALKRRRCYATTGGRILLFFAIEGAPMGSEVIAGQEGIRGTAEVKGTAEIESVTIVKNNQDWLVRPGNSCEITIPFADRQARCGDFYYVRVRQRDGELAWASPIWIKSREED